MLQPIQTARLQLIPYSLKLKKATLEDRTSLETMLGVHVPSHWPLPDYSEALPFFIRLMENDLSVGNYFSVDRDTPFVILHFALNVRCEIPQCRIFRLNIERKCQDKK